MISRIANTAMRSKSECEYEEGREERAKPEPPEGRPRKYGSGNA
jgi:hypothetical protein